MADGQLQREIAAVLAQELRAPGSTFIEPGSVLALVIEQTRDKLYVSQN